MRKEAGVEVSDISQEEFQSLCHPPEKNMPLGTALLYGTVALITLLNKK